MGPGKIFISYARADLAYVRRLVAFLARAGVATWFDEDIPTGDLWERVLHEQIETCSSLLVVMSPAAADSDWVAKEIRFARALNKPILPLLLAGGPIFELDEVQFESVTDGAMPGLPFVERLRGTAPHRSSTRHLVGLVPDAADCFQQRAVGRRLDEALAESGTAILVGAPAQILSGLGGVGKTQLAARVARRMRDSGDLRLLAWLSASSSESIVSGLAQAGTELTGADPGDPRAAAVALLQFLGRTTSTWLVVFDDLVDPRDADGWWPPRTSTGRVIVTTRRRDAALTARGILIEVGRYTAAEAHAYLADKFAAQPERLMGADELARELGYLPVALAQAATYIADRSLTCVDYSTRFADRRRSLMELSPEVLPDDYTRPVAVTLSLSVEHANRLAPVGVSRPLMAVLALLDPDGVPTDLLAASALREYLIAHRDPPNRAEQLDDDAIRDALSCLVRLNLTDIDTGAELTLIRVHALVQRAVRDQTPAEVIDDAVEAAARSLMDVWPATQQSSAAGQALRANAGSLHSHGGERLWQPANRVLLSRLGQSLGEVGLVFAAEEYFRLLTAEAQVRLGGGNRDTLAIRYRRASWLGEAGDASGALAALAALEVDQARELGPDDPDTLRTRSDHASWRGEAGDAAGAVAALEAVLADQRRALGDTHPDTLTTRHELAYWRGDAGDVGSAVTGTASVLADRIRVLGPDHPSTLITRSNLAFWRGEAGDAAGAVAEMEELLADRLRVLGPDHPDTLVTRHNIAGWRGKAGDAVGAAAGFEALLADQERLLGPDNPHTLRTRNSLAVWRGETGDMAGAIAAFEALLLDQQRILGADYPATLSTRHHLAAWRGEAGDVVAAVTSFAALLFDQVRVLGANHPDTLRTRGELARWQAAAGDVAKAAAALADLLADQLRILGPRHPDTMTTQRRLQELRRM